MARKIIDIGIVGNDGTGDSIRDSFRKVNENFRELYSSLGLGEKLTLIELDDLRLNRDTPPYKELGGYLGQENAVLSVNSDESGVAFRQLVGESGVAIDFSVPGEIRFTTEFSALVADPEPKLGGTLSARSGGLQHRIIDLGTDLSPLFPIYQHEATSKGYVDTKLSLSGTEAIDPASGQVNTGFGKMTGPLILSRDPTPEDDEVYEGLIAATKRYVDNSGFGSKVNLYVATSGEDDRVGVTPELQGRALSYAYRTLEAALKKAEEIILESRVEMGAYKKVLTYNGGDDTCILEQIDDAPFAGSGFAGRAFVSVDTIKINNPGQNYAVGDIITLVGGISTQPATYEVLSIGALPGTNKGPVLTFRQLTSGVYSEVPGGTAVTTSVNRPFGVNCTFDVTYKVNNVIVDEPGSGYGLVSVRITGGGGNGAFGTADVVGGGIQSITVTDQGSGFTGVPQVLVSLPRFLIKTDFQRTDFTGDVTTNTASAVRGRDIREGLYLRGEESGALAQILSHSGALDSEGREIFDVDIKYGQFITSEDRPSGGEAISYGDVAKETQITVLVESGIYEENLPLKIPPNVSIVGDEFRRCIVRPKPGPSSSPWSFTYFRRDITIGGPPLAQQVFDNVEQIWEEENIPGDTLVLTSRTFGHHYLTDPGNPVYPLVNNKGFYRAAAELLKLNRQFLQKEVIAWIDYQIEKKIAPFDDEIPFEYNSNICERDVGLLLDSIIFDLKWGGNDRTISAALKYYGNASGLKAITDQQSQTVAANRRLLALAQLVIKNVPITELYQLNVPQIIDNAFISESGTFGVEKSIIGISQTDPVAVTTDGPHGLAEGQHIVISGVIGSTELNGNDFWISIIDGTAFYLYNDEGLTDPVNESVVSNYVSGGIVTNLGGVLGELIDAFIDVIEGSVSVNQPKLNNEMDMFLCNDSVRLQAITGQGHGGFMMVLDPTGQILSRSPYAQECASFSQSTGRQRFAGGMFVDGFVGNLKFRILSKDTNTFLRVGELKRFPQLPASFIVNDTVYRINYVRDFTFNTEGSTASFIMDETTPWPFDLFSYDEGICYRDVGLIIDGLGFDLVFGSNYNARKAGLSYRQANASVVIEDQLDLTARAITVAHDLAIAKLNAYPGTHSQIRTAERIIIEVVRNGAVFAPPLSLPNPPGLPSALNNAKILLLNNIKFIQEEVIGYIADNYPVYNREKCYRDVGLIIEAVLNDLVFGSNYQSVTAGLAYYRDIASSLYVTTEQKTETLAGINKARDLVLAITSDSGAESVITANFAIVTDILENGVGVAPSLSYPVPGAVDSGISNAASLINANKAFLKTIVTGWIADQVSSETDPFESGFTYNIATCQRDVELLIDALRYDLLYGGNTSTVAAGEAYYQGAVISGQVDQTIAAYEFLSSILVQVAQNITVVTTYGADPQVPGSAGSLEAADILADRIDDLVILIGGGVITPVNPTYTLGNSTYAAERVLVQAEKLNIQEETVNWLEEEEIVFAYDDIKCRRDVGYIIEGVVYDLIYGGNSQSVDSGKKYYSSILPGGPSQIPATQKSATIDALSHARYLAKQVIVNAPPAVVYSSEPQITGVASDAPTQGLIDGLMIIIEDIIDNGVGSAPAVVLPDLDDYVYSVTTKAAKVVLDDSKEDIQDGTVAFVNDNANVYEVLTPGNRSMLSNDFTQLNDMGYGVIVTNGALTECVSMFTYYNYISYYSVNGGQVRSVAGSSAHGVYALVAEGADPLEVPTPVTLYYDLSQGAECYFPSGLYANIQGGQEIYLTNYDYVPLDNSEIEIDHGLGALYRYPVTTVSTSGLPAGVAKLNLKSAAGVGEEGLVRQVSDGTKVTLRQAAQTVLTGDVVDVATRPSTGLVLREAGTVYRILQFQDYPEPQGPRAITITIGSPTFINRANHGLLPGYQISLQTTGTLPNGVTAGEIYYVLPDGYTENRFAISATKNGLPINTSGVQSGSQSYIVRGLARTTMRENYDYIDLTVWPEQPFSDSGVSTCTISIGNPAIITQVNHNLAVNDVIRFETTGTLPGGISSSRHYFVKEILTANTFTICQEAVPTSPALETVGSQSGTHGCGTVIGREGDSTIAVVAVGPVDEERILSTKFVFQGELYQIISYSNTATTLEPYALLTLNRPLVDSAVYFSSPPTFKAGVPVNEPGTLTIRISLTRVTGHDLLEIGTGSYADTNYPSEIYGPPVNPINAANETQERDVGRVFYVTTDQFGNFQVGPYFKVDQGTGTVTFSAAIALSNLDGIGFKRGVPISEFSTDSSFSDNATDTVPTENATRTYLDRRLGLNHNGNIVPESNLIPTLTGGFMALDGQLSMKGEMNLANNKIINVGNATALKDAVNLQSLTFSNFQNTDVTSPKAADILAFTGTGDQAINAEMIGDIDLTVNVGNNTINAQINPNTIINSDVKSDAAILQSKLAMNLATTSASAPTATPVAATSIITGRRYRIEFAGSTVWTNIGAADNNVGTIFQATAIGTGSGTAIELDSIQNSSGVVSFKASEFTVTNGWVELQSSSSASTGIEPAKLQHIGSNTVLGRSSGGVGAVSPINMSDVVEIGGGIQKDQYSSSTGFLRRIGFTFNNDSDYTVVDMASGTAASPEPSKLVVRNSNGDFGARNVDLSRLLIDNKVTIDTAASGVTGAGFTQYHGFSGQVGILIGDGPAADGSDKRSFYDNNRHEFRTQNGLANAPVKVSELTATAITTGAAATAGTVTGNWSLTAGSKFQATYADLAEYYEGDKEYEVGTVLIFGGDREVTLANKLEDHRVAGVVTNTAAYIMNNECTGTKVLIALQGRVPVRVVGKIEKGDLLVTSNINGVAVSVKGNARVGTVIGKSLENYDSDHIGTIEVAVGRT